MKLDPHPFCWQCGGDLEVKPAPNGGHTVIFSEYTDPIGNVHKVHKVCKKTLDEDGWGNPNPYPKHQPEEAEPDSPPPLDGVLR